MAQGPVSKRRVSRRAVRRAMMLTGAVVVALLVAAGVIFIYYSHGKEVAAATHKRFQDQARGYAQAVAKPFSALDEKLVAVGRARDVVAAFSAHDKAALAAAAQAHQAEFPDALKLRLLLPGNYEAGADNGQPPLSFAALEMLKRAMNSDGTVSAEVDLFGGPDQHVAMVERSTDKGGQLIGLLHLSLKVSIIEPVVKGLNPAGYVELVQGSGNDALKLGAAGDKALASGTPYQASVPNTRWNLLYWPSLHAGGGGQLPWLAIAVAIVLIIVAVLVFGLMRRRGAGAGSSDSEHPQVVYAGAVKAIMDGAHPGMEKLVPNLPHLGQKAPIQPVSQGMVGDDVTMIMNKADLQAEAGDMINISPASERRDDTTPPAAPKPAKRPAPKAAPGRAPSAAPPKAAPPKAAPPSKAAAAAAEHDSGGGVPPGIFRAYDIRGVVDKELTVDVMHKIGHAIGSEAVAKRQKSVIVGRDGRNSSPELAKGLTKGLLAAGVNVIDIGMVPTPLLYFATHELNTHSGVMVTGSHNGPEYNGLKIVLAGQSLSEAALHAVYKRIEDNDMESGSGTASSKDVVADYVRRVAEDVPVALGHSFKVVVDCGNGVAGAVVPQLLRALGHDVIELYCDVDGNFPNHHPDPSQPENLAPLIDMVKSEQADLGLAFDGDGDRLGVVDGEGTIIWPDRQLMLLARDVLSRNAGATILFDVKCSRYLRAIIESSGGKPLMWRTGHSLIKAKMKEVEAPLAGEMSGHIFFKERWYGFDDALYAAARLLEVLTKSKAAPTAVFAELPQGVSTPELRVSLPEAAHQEFMDQLKGKMSFEGATIIDIDGIRAEFADGWGLIRPSNTSPVLVLRFEADNPQALERIQSEFRKLIQSIRPDLTLPF